MTQHRQPPIVVSILTRPEGRVQVLVGYDVRGEKANSRVSILTRPEGRVQAGVHDEDALVDYEPGFNPHPARRPGARTQALPGAAASRLPGFNPHPARRPGARLDIIEFARCQPVSILTRPEGRVQGLRVRQLRLGDLVSILTRPEGRVQASASLHYPGSLPLRIVSILTRPEGRVQVSTN